MTDACADLSCAESSCEFCYDDVWNDWGECPGTACANEACVGCAVFPDGPCGACELNTNLYLPMELNWYRPVYCSATGIPSATPETANSRWCVRFDNGLVFLSGKYEQATADGEEILYENPRGVVCVR